MLERRFFKFTGHFPFEGYAQKRQKLQHKPTHFIGKLRIMTSNYSRFSDLNQVRGVPCS
jgi:hypothetical protein